MYLLRRFLGERFARTNAIIGELEGRLSGYINLVASASYPFPEVLQALSMPFSVFPVEGLAGKRYLPAGDIMDRVEFRAEELLLSLFQASAGYRATIQPHSGTQANQVVYHSTLRSGDVVSSARTASGGHISHTVLVGRQNRVAYYEVTPGGHVDLDSLRKVLATSRPRLIIVGGSSLPRAQNFERIAGEAHEHGAYVLADISHTAIFQCAGIHPPVLPHADFVTFNTAKNLRGPSGGVLIYREQFAQSVSKALFPTTQGGPLENSLFAKCVGLECLRHYPIKEYAQSMIRNAGALARALERFGLPSITEGTDSHLVLTDIRNSGLTGAQAEELLESHRVLANRNLIPGDPHPPLVASGIRFGLACCTILGYKESDVQRLGEWIGQLILGRAPSIPSLLDSLLSRYHSAFMNAP